MKGTRTFSGKRERRSFASEGTIRHGSTFHFGITLEKTKPCAAIQCEENLRVPFDADLPAQDRPDQVSIVREKPKPCPTVGNDMDGRLPDKAFFHFDVLIPYHDRSGHVLFPSDRKLIDGIDPL